MDADDVQAEHFVTLIYNAVPVVTAYRGEADAYCAPDRC
jgi:hypothetical protein